MRYEAPILVDLEDLEDITGGGCNTGGMDTCGSGDLGGGGGEETDIDVEPV